jgi:SAM-dependent methyltransferase
MLRKGARETVTPFSELADHRDATSLAARLRAKRVEFFFGLLASVPRPLTILDVGGTAGFWETARLWEPDVELIILNLQTTAVSLPGYRFVTGDARDLSAFPDQSVDIVYSNSVIEHVGGPGDQARMAREIRRVGKRYFVQTPNYRFPVEPHFVFPAFQFLPLAVRAFLLTKFRLGWFEREQDWNRALQAVGSITLLTKGQFKKLFPEARLYEERLLGLTKSFVAYYGW